MLVTNEYGRSLANPNLYRISAMGDLYTFQSYASLYISIESILLNLPFSFKVISSVTPNTGSTQGGTNLIINGNYFCDSTQYPIVVNVGGEVCTVSNVSQTTIECTTPAEPTVNQSQYQGKN